MEIKFDQDNVSSYVNIDIHLHDYTYLYERYTATQHKAFCNCGDYVLSVHAVSAGVSGRYKLCIACGEMIDTGILWFSFEEYDSWTMNDIEIDGGTVLLYGSADQTIYIDSTGNRIESVESPYCFCIEIEQSKIDSATVINWQIAYYDIIEKV